MGHGGSDSHSCYAGARGPTICVGRGEVSYWFEVRVGPSALWVCSKWTSLRSKKFPWCRGELRGESQGGKTGGQS